MWGLFRDVDVGRRRQRAAGAVGTRKLLWRAKAAPAPAVGAAFGSAAEGLGTGRYLSGRCVRVRVEAMAEETALLLERADRLTARLEEMACCVRLWAAGWVVVVAAKSAGEEAEDAGAKTGGGAGALCG